MMAHDYLSDQEDILSDGDSTGLGLGNLFAEGGKSEGHGIVEVLAEEKDGESHGNDVLFAGNTALGKMDGRLQRVARPQDSVSGYAVIIQRLQYLQPEELGKNGWREDTPDEMKYTSSKEYVYTEGGKLRIRYDEGRNGTGNHYHVYNPNSSNRRDRYLDTDGKVVNKGSRKSHIYIKERSDNDSRNAANAI